MPPTLDIVIVNWNTGGALAGCLTSVSQAVRRLPGTRVVVVDNASADASVADALSAAPGTIAIRNRANLGFAAACNQRRP